MKTKTWERIILVCIFLLCSVHLWIGYHLSAIDIIENAEAYLFWVDARNIVRLLVIVLLPVSWLVHDLRKRNEQDY